MINLKTEAEIKIMREGGKIAVSVLRQVIEKVRPGISTSELNRYADELIVKAGAEASFKKEKGYHWATCMCVNDGVVHGIPSDYKLLEGDKLCIDLGVYYKGWHADTAWSVLIGDETKVVSSLPAGKASETIDRDKRFLEAGKKALEKAIAECVVGNHIGDISAAMQGVVERAGYSCVKQLVGHGVGRELHEDPEVPCFQRGEIKNTPLLKEGMTLAIEVIYNMGESPVVYKNDDGWTVVTRDGLPSAVFEHTVAVTKSGPHVLTA